MYFKINVHLFSKCIKFFDTPQSYFKDMIITHTSMGFSKCS